MGKKRPGWHKGASGQSIRDLAGRHVSLAARRSGGRGQKRPPDHAAMLCREATQHSKRVDVKLAARFGCARARAALRGGKVGR